MIEKRRCKETEENKMMEASKGKGMNTKEREMLKESKENCQRGKWVYLHDREVEEKETVQ